MKIVFASFTVLMSIFYMILFLRSFHILNSHYKTHIYPKTIGILSLITSDILLLSVTFLYFDYSFWWILLFAATICSQTLIFKAWKTMKYFSISNFIFFFPVVISIFSILPTSLRSQYQSDLSKNATKKSIAQLLTENDVVHLPLQVQKYLQFTGAIGKPKIYSFHARMNGMLRMEPGGRWYQIEAGQSNSYTDRNRIFFIKTTLWGIPFDGFHRYTSNRATMQIQIAHSIKVVDAKGEKMTQSETVTMFNDMCLLAPAALIDPSIQWEENGPTSVTARFTNNEYTISAHLFFDTSGALINFISDDRYFSLDGKDYERHSWSTPVKSYQTIGGRKIFSKAEASWKMPDGEFLYASFFLKEIEYNF